MGWLSSSPCHRTTAVSRQEIRPSHSPLSAIRRENTDPAHLAIMLSSPEIKRRLFRNISENNVLDSVCKLFI